MKKSIITLGIFLLGFINFALAQGNYYVIINQDTVSVNMNQTVQYKTTSGEHLTLKIAQPNVLTYSDDMVSFSHDKTFSVSNSEIDEGIDQCMIMSSTGNGFMVQKYRTINPSSLTQLMLNEITKESINYGYEKSESEFKKQLKSGQTIEGIQATLTYKGDKEVYTVATYGKKDEGIIVVTMLLNEDYPKDKEIIDLFLETLELKNL
ncbi:hypothetical protein [Flagellimonas zhangzhouensis]|uniref:Uncharacterized protein n=1 Tax=Flagellimonas zhangzhouensis TaxID=1073328 RepID=A0A1H2STF9_9FLAO|nr:hypothetical protein [Allomuricauda zhangzhouensis]SDQ78980.1 hypothetical protein SAMN05216294_2610 [Allomuricauda zhangzhouensis]SDW34745.1 hypothetical protein SAMN04487892_1251 [Allomuricauda zhangzhouensis]